MTHPESIPSILFDWIELFSFSDLNDSQRELVLQYFSKDEYDELYTNCQLLKESSLEFNYTTYLPPKISSVWDSKFETKNHFKIFGSKSVLWRIAASILLFGLGWSINTIQRGKAADNHYTKTIIDTVFVESKVNPIMVKIVDSVYKAYVPKQKYIPFTASRSSKATPKIIKSNDVSEELDNSLNKQKRNSLKDDKLAGQFEISVL